jgi:ribokinase
VLETKVAGTAGAGDAFNATFTALVAMGRSAEEALRAAAINSASVVGHIDTQSGLLSLDEIDRRLAATKATLEVRRWSH